jgi:hypothetical protein
MNYWIVAHHEFVLHGSCQNALTEAARLANKLGKPFHVYRVKNKLRPGDQPGRIAVLVAPDESSASE